MMIDISVQCKNCGFVQEHTQNTEHPERIVCQNCGSVIVRKPPEPRPKQQEIRNKYDTWCRKCKKFLSVGTVVYWTPGKKWVLCGECKR